MKIFIGADHNGFEYKQHIVDLLKRDGYEVFDDGDGKLDPADDFPQFASRVAISILGEQAKNPDTRGILICGSGQGMCMAANRFKGIRACLCWDVEEARASRNDDDSNVLCLSARYLSLEETKPILATWLSTPFAGAARFRRRIKELDELA